MLSASRGLARRLARQQGTWAGGLVLDREGAGGLPAVGDRVALSRTFGPAEVQTFAEVSGDNNPLHLDEEFAKQSRFGATICHGMLSASLFSTIFGVQLPGSVYLTQQLKFEAPVFVGAEVVASVEVTRVREDRRFVTCTTEVHSEGRRVVSGEAMVMLPAP